MRRSERFAVEFRMYEQKILCATDGTELSDKAVTLALSWAEMLQQSLAFIMVIDGSEMHFTVWDQARIEAGDLPVDRPLLAALERARQAGLTHLSCVRAAGSNIAQAIVTYAEKNNYHHIIAGSAGRSGTARFLKGSVAEDIVVAAHCPVTIAR
jgi:nucleotide-binding universal stress UspA family protein